ncbi:adenylyl-sulfate kinase [Arthrobacter sp. NamB2]|uniref:nucleotide-binding protein n=1 Tax=Arthrobacter sp. NamB2 TaxID=2576035 RepID=UPI0010C9FD4A|nr:adenylyl-sulfate kinase [Arthrobacter sp. NamB2]TKV29202.1 adenylyl-sulfate kinase [Arthrobacter sp. NamB2]
MDSAGTSVLFIGGRSGVGKTTVALALHDLLVERGVRHAVVEGDALDLAYPEPWEHRLAERNLAAIWSNYRALGYRRLIYTNTVSVLETGVLSAAMGDAPAVVAVLLEADTTTANTRLAGRETGRQLEDHRLRSARAAERLAREAPDAVHRIRTTARSPEDVAAQILALLEWDQST